MFAIVDVLSFALGVLLVALTAIINRDRERTGSGLVTIGCYALFLDVTTIVAAKLTSNTDLPYAPDWLLLLALLFVSVVTVVFGFHLLGARVKYIVWALVLWSCITLTFGVFTLLEIIGPSIFAGTSGLNIVAGGFLIEVAGSILVVLLFLGRGIIRERYRRTTLVALALGAGAAVLVTKILYLDGPERWYQADGVGIVVTGIGMAMAVFLVASAISGESQRREPAATRRFGKLRVLLAVIVATSVIVPSAAVTDDAFTQQLSGAWTTVAPMPAARDSLAAVTGRDGRIYAIAGEQRPGTLRYTILPPTDGREAPRCPLPAGTWPQQPARMGESMSWVASGIRASLSGPSRSTLP